MKVLFCSSEVAEYAKTGGLADVSSALPQELIRQGIDCRVVMPLYKSIREKGIPMKHVSDISFLSGHGISSGRVFAYEHTYFIENNTYFGRDGLYSYAGKDYPDNLERFAFYSRACIEMLSLLGPFDLVHCNDWQSALIPAYIKALGIDSLATLFTIHNLAYQGIFNSSAWPILLLPEEFLRPDYMEFFGNINVLKGGIAFSDMINTVSPSYALEIQTPQFGAGLDGLLKSVSHKLTGIINGIDTAVWNPLQDRLIAQPYSCDDMSGKMQCKKDLQKRFSLDQGDHPVFGMIGRLVEQKGIDMVVDVIPELAKTGSQIVILGNGHPRHEKELLKMSSLYPGQLGIHIGFDEGLAHIIEAGSDFFLMPSAFEPCGLNQMISMRYGTIPIVTSVGGLKDTVEALGEGDNPCGLRVSSPNKDAMLSSVLQAHRIFTQEKQLVISMRNNAMKKNVGWEISAQEYMHLYQKIKRF
ncbi:MAG: glycogen synthase GlgA [Deltaproteobacteria bacterium]|nr:glycogen synthase GlgA [Deltaproteobacteria bacterium]